MTLSTRVLRLNAAAARSMSRRPSTQRRVLGAVSCAAAGGGSSAGHAAPPGGASKPQRSTPSGRPAGRIPDFPEQCVGKDGL